MNATDREFMEYALFWAKRAGQRGEIPIGAVLVSASKTVLAAAHNSVIELCDPTAHAEILALRAAGERVGNYRLPGAALYVTVEPCPMCMGAAIHSRVGRVVFGAHDPKWGAAGSLYDFAADPRFNHHPEVLAGVMAAECRKLIQSFFRAKRQKPED